MITRRLAVSMVICAVVFLSRAVWAADPPRQSLIFGPWIVQPPSGSDWTKKRQNNEGVAWVRADGLIAYFNAFPLPPLANRDAFVAEVKKFAEATLVGRTGGTLIDAQSALSGSRPYPCVKAGIVVDSPAGGSNPKAAAVRVQSRVLICRSNEESRVGVLVGFAYPGQHPSAALDAAASAFHRGVVLEPRSTRRLQR